MAIYFISSLFIMLFGYFFQPMLNKKRKKIFIIVSFGILIIIAAMRHYTVGIDVEKHYMRRFLEISDFSLAEIPTYAKSVGYEIGYCYFTKLLSMISTDPQCYIIGTSLIMMGAMAYFIYQKSEDVLMSTMLFVFSCTYYMYMNIVRQGMAVSIVLIGYVLFSKSQRKIWNYIVFAGFILLASTFHSSAVLCFLIILFDFLGFKRIHIIISIVITVVAYLFYSQLYAAVVGFLGSNGQYERYIESSSEGVGYINFNTIFNFLLVFGAFLLGYYALIWRRKKIVHKLDTNIQKMTIRNDNVYMYMCLMATICRLLVMQMNIINRFAHYFIPFVFLLYPRAVCTFIPHNKRIIAGIIYFAYILFFVYMTVYNANSFYGTVPYITFNSR